MLRDNEPASYTRTSLLDLGALALELLFLSAIATATLAPKLLLLAALCPALPLHLDLSLQLPAAT